MTTLDIYWSFRSPYSYLAIERLIKIADLYEVEAHFRPVRPLALREDDFFKKARPQFLPYLMLDVRREAERLDMAIAPPQPDPVVMNMMSGEVDAEQPFMDLLMGLGLAACEKGRGLEFAKAVSHLIWGGVEGWHEGDHLRAAAHQAGLDLADLQEWVQNHEGHIPAMIAEHERAQLKHHWGAPLMVIDDEEAFFGQDRLDALIWRLKKLGTKPERRR